MRKVVAQFVWCEVWEHLKKNFFYWLVMIIAYVGTYYTVYAEKSFGIFGNLITYFSLWIVIARRKVLPLRICKGTYVCPMDGKWKLHYLGAKVAVRTVWYMLYITLFFWVCGGWIALQNDFSLHAIFFMLIFFTALNVAARLEIEEEGNVKEDERGFRICSKAEKMVRTNSLILLTLEWACFVLYLAGTFPTGKSIAGFLGMMCFMVNVFILVKYMRPYLLELLDYERVYSYKPEGEVVQYDV